MHDHKVINGIKIDPLIFTFKYACPCSGGCCFNGAAMDIEHHQLLVHHEEKIKQVMDESQNRDSVQWFKPDVINDADFPSGKAIRTQIHKGSCVFLNLHGHCVLQKLSMEEGKHKWHYKPFYCWLYPLLIEHGVLTVDKEHMNTVSKCNRSPSSQTTFLYDFCQEELHYLFGDEGLVELNNYRKDYINNLTNK